MFITSYPIICVLLHIGANEDMPPDIRVHLLQWAPGSHGLGQVPNVMATSGFQSQMVTLASKYHMLEAINVFPYFIGTFLS